MGRSTARRKNSKARSGIQGKKVSSSGGHTKDTVGGEVTIELDVDPTKYDEANRLVLPSGKVDGGKERSEVEAIKKKPKKVLSLKKQKKLRKVLERKQKIQDRSAILEELKKYQLDSSVLSALSSSNDFHTKGLKRSVDEVLAPMESDTTKPLRTVNKRKRKQIITTVDKRKTPDNVIGFEKSDDEDEEESDEDPEAEIEDEKSKKPEEVLETDRVSTEKDEVTKEDSKEEKAPLVSEENTVVQPEKEKAVEKKNQKSSEEPAKDQTPFVNMTTQFVPVVRTAEIEASRSRLPIIAEEQAIMEKIRYNDVVILCGETGSGKTTQIPQFLYEAGYAIDRRIGITEPRRVAAIAMAHRVSQEMNLSSEIVSYQIRFEGNTTDQTKIKFMTDGILMKEIQKDILLSSYSVIIIDEAHERTVYSDILIGLLSRIIKLRSKKKDPLKLIIMSATLRVDDFTGNLHLFKSKPPIIEIKSRQFTVQKHFSKVTPDDYASEAYKKVCEIHQNTPKNGGILVFLTGQQEVISLCQKLQKTFPFNESSVAKQKEKQEDLESKKLSLKEAKKLRKTKPQTLADISPQIDLDVYGQDIDLADDVSDSEETEDHGGVLDDNVISCSDPLYVLPLYSHLNEHRQKKIFEDPPEDVRLCVVSTNIAETSLTIPNIRYVVDTGKVKVKIYDQVTGISTFIIDWTSKASADQRAGRSGRMGPGHCYRLYSSAVYSDNFKDFSEPEIVRKPIDDLVLQMKAMNIDNVINFPFPTPPKAETVTGAEKRLVLLGALKSVKTLSTKNNTKRYKRFNKKTQFKEISRITALGKVLSLFPLSPRYSKMLILSSQHNLITYGVAIVSSLTVQELFTSHPIADSDDLSGKRLYKDKNMIIKKRWARTGNSLLLGDMMIFLCAAGAWEHHNCAPDFCSTFGLRLKAMTEIRKLRHQLHKEILTIFPQVELPPDLKMDPPTDGQAKCLRQVLLSGLLDHVARIMPEGEKSDEDRKKLRKAYSSVEVDLPVFISVDSVLHDLTPEWVVYQEIYETQKLYMRHAVAIEPEWLPIYAKSMCTFSKPLLEPMPRYDETEDCIKCTVTCTYGPHNWQIPDTEIEYPETDDGFNKYHWFVRFLLEGEIVQYFSSKKSLLLSPPSIMQKSWYKLQSRTQGILITLQKSQICSKKGLIEKWKQDSNYLLDEYLQWIPQAHHQEIQSEWPPLSET